MLAVAVKLRYLAGADSAIAQGMAALRRPALEETAQALTCFGDSRFVLSMMAVMSLWWWSKREFATTGILWGTWGLGFVLQILLRFWVAQWRPDALAVPDSMDLVDRFELAGFTSGHAFRSAFLYGWWGGSLWQRGTKTAQAGVVACAVLILAVGVTRIYLERHWPTDILGSWLVAMVALSAAELWRCRTTNRAGNIVQSADA
jgi:undecaprenyl-diphosphatase